MSTFDSPTDKAIDTLPSKASIEQMRTDWLVLEKERLERKVTDSKGPDLGDPTRSEILTVIESELNRRGTPSEQSDFEYEGLFPSGDR